MKLKSALNIVEYEMKDGNSYQNFESFSAHIGIKE